jgi:hypothetical protein
MPADPQTASPSFAQLYVYASNVRTVGCRRSFLRVDGQTDSQTVSQSLLTGTVGLPYHSDHRQYRYGYSYRYSQYPVTVSMSVPVPVLLLLLLLLRVLLTTALVV